MGTPKPLIFFDGVCHLCNGFVDAVIQRDRKARYQFAPLQGETATKQLPAEDRARLETVILLEGGQTYRRSEAVLRILVGLGGFYKLFLAGFLIPTFLRDKVYLWVAHHRYKWFGERDFCRLPEPHEKERLLP